MEKLRRDLIEEETDDDGDGKIEGDQNDNGKDYGGKTGDDVGGKVVGGIINESKEEDHDDNEGPPKRHSNRKTIRVEITE